MCKDCYENMDATSTFKEVIKREKENNNFMITTSSSLEHLKSISPYVNVICGHDSEDIVKIQSIIYDTDPTTEKELFTAAGII